MLRSLTSILLLVLFAVSLAQTDPPKLPAEQPLPVTIIWDSESTELREQAKSIGRLPFREQSAAAEKLKQSKNWIFHEADRFQFFIDASLVRLGFHKALERFPWPKKFEDFKAFRLSDLDLESAKTMRTAILGSPYGTAFDRVSRTEDPALYYRLTASISRDGKEWAPSEPIQDSDTNAILKMSPSASSAEQAQREIERTSEPSQTIIQVSEALSQPNIRLALNKQALDLIVKLRDEQRLLERQTIEQALQRNFGKLNDGSLLDKEKRVRLQDFPVEMQERLTKAFGPQIGQGTFQIQLRYVIGFPTENGLREFDARMIR